MVEVVSVRPSSKELGEFLNLPFQLYSQNPNWLPPQKKSEAALISGNHPCSKFLQSKAFLAKSNANAVGRITAFFNPKGTTIQFTVGQFECINNKDVSRKLFDVAFSWCKEKGAISVFGPMNGTIWNSYRQLKKPFDKPSYYGEPYNLPYYHDLFLDAGFKPIGEWISLTPSKEDLQGFYHRSQKAQLVLQSKGYSFRSFKFNRMESELEIVHELVMDSFQEFLGFHKLDYETFKALFSGLKMISKPELLPLAIAPNGEVVGFAVALVNYPRAFRALKGSDSPLAKLRFLWNKKNPDSVVLLYLGKKSHLGRQAAGIGLTLMRMVHEAAKKMNLPVTHALMSETATPRNLTPLVESRMRTYCLYEKDL